MKMDPFITLTSNNESQCDFGNVCQTLPNRSDIVLVHLLDESVVGGGTSNKKLEADETVSAASIMPISAGQLIMTTISSSTQIITSGFYKFLARFSGRRRQLRKHYHTTLVLQFTLILILSTLCNNTDACSSRTTPKPRPPPPTPTPRPNITFPTYKCPQAYADWYCLNDATCFTVKIGDSLLYNCECADGYMGPRCEYKDLDGTYLPTKPDKMLQTASMYSGAIGASILVLFMVCYGYVKCHRQKKWRQFEMDENGRAENGGSTATGIDTVDGIVRSVATPLTAAAAAVAAESATNGHHNHHHNGRIPAQRPFGPHHYNTIPM